MIDTSAERVYGFFCGMLAGLLHIVFRDVSVHQIVLFKAMLQQEVGSEILVLVTREESFDDLVSGESKRFQLPMFISGRVQQTMGAHTLSIASLSSGVTLISRCPAAGAPPSTL
jgi:hypothetical protein